MSQPTPQFSLVAKEIADANNLGDPEFKASGAFKETFRAVSATDAAVALKILDPTKANLSRSQREVDAMCRCNFDGIAKLYVFNSFKASDGRTYHYMLEEFFEGGTLGDRLTNGFPQTSEVRKLGLALAGSLAHMKSLDLVHRDIKPENIMFRTQEDFDPVLVDFGLVRDLSSSSLTQTWLPQGPGTPLFASPEQLNNEKAQIGWRSDQFSLGIVLSYCLNLGHPFAEPGWETPDIVAAIASKRPCSDGFRRSASELGFSGIIRMLDPWPVRRYATPADLHSAIGEEK